MTYSGHANIATDTFQKSSRGGYGINRFQLHHSATTDGPGVVSMMTSGSREVSANYVIYTNGTIVGVVPEEYRAWTSGSSTYDSQAITFEIANSSVGGSWPVSGESHAAVARVIADASKRYGIPINRDTVYGHREMLPRFGVSYSTACPGGLQMDWIVDLANSYASGLPTNATQGEDDMYAMYRYPEGAAGGADAGKIFWQQFPGSPLILIQEHATYAAWAQGRSPESLNQTKAVIDGLRAKYGTGTKYELASVGNVSIPALDQTGVIAALAKVEAAVKKLNPAD